MNRGSHAWHNRWEWRRQKFHRFRQLEPSEQLLGLHMALLVPLAAVALRLFQFKTMMEGTSRLVQIWQADPAEDAAVIVPRSLRCLRRVEQYGPYRGNCLSRSLTLWWLLRRHGLLTELRIGVRMEAGEFQAHAWVEYQGLPLNEDANVRERYAVFDRPILADGWTFR